MNKLQEQLKAFATRYAPFISTIIQNMRLVLLIVFSIMAGYLVFRVNSLLNQEVSPPADEIKTTQKSPDAATLSVFDELTEQQVQLDSEFQPDRVNPF